jgi:hypothetical protein
MTTHTIKPIRTNPPATAAPIIAALLGCLAGDFSVDEDRLGVDEGSNGTVAVTVVTSVGRAAIRHKGLGWVVGFVNSKQHLLQINSEMGSNGHLGLRVRYH